MVAYAITLRGRNDLAALVPPGVRTAVRRFPARLARQAWLRSEHPRLERWTGPVDVVHATNYVRAADGRARGGVGVRPRVRALPGARGRRRARLPELLRRAVRRGAWFHTTSDFVRDEVIETFAAAARARRARVPRRPADRRGRRDRADARSREASGTCSPSAPSNPARTTRRWCAPSTRSRPTTPRRAGGRRHARVGRRRVRRRASRPPITRIASSSPGYVSADDRARPARGRVGARLPVALRGLRDPAARGDGRRRAGGGHSRRCDPRGGRRRRAAGRRSRRRRRPRRRAPARAHRRDPAARPGRSGPHSPPRLLLDRRPSTSCSTCTTAVRGVKAVVTGARGFVGRYLTRHLDSLGVDVVSLDVDDNRPGRHHRPRRGRARGSPARRPTSCTTSRRGATSARRGPTATRSPT